MTPGLRAVGDKLYTLDELEVSPPPPLSPPAHMLPDVQPAVCKPAGYCRASTNMLRQHGQQRVTVYSSTTSISLRHTRACSMGESPPSPVCAAMVWTAWRRPSWF
jgi:hypothetical protein